MQATSIAAVVAAVVLLVVAAAYALPMAAAKEGFATREQAMQNSVCGFYAAAGGSLLNSGQAFVEAMMLQHLASGTPTEVADATALRTYLDSPEADFDEYLLRMAAYLDKYPEHQMSQMALNVFTQLGHVGDTRTAAGCV